MECSIPDDDIKLIEEYKNGNKLSLEKIYYKYKSRLLKIIWYYVHNVQDAEDILQTLFIKVINNINKYRPYKDVKFRTWLFRVAVNTAKDFLKIKKTEFDIEQYEGKEMITAGSMEKIEDKELINEIRKSVMLLPLKYREVVSLVYFENLQYDEAADILNKPVGTVKSRMNYALNLLRKRVKADLS